MNIVIRDLDSKTPIEDGRVYVEKNGKGIHNEPIMEGKAYLNVQYGDNVLIRIRSAEYYPYRQYEFRGILTGGFNPIIYMKPDF